MELNVFDGIVPITNPINPNNQLETTLKKNTADLATTDTNYLKMEQADSYMTAVTDRVSVLPRITRRRAAAISGNMPTFRISEENWAGIEEGECLDQLIDSNIDSVPYHMRKIAAKAIMTRDFQLFNIENFGIETKFTSMVTNQHSLDLEKLALSGDTTHPTSRFYRSKDGYIKQIRTANTHVLDFNNGAFSQEVFRRLYEAIPLKYDKSNYVWIVPQGTIFKFTNYLGNRQTSAGDAALLQLDPKLRPYGHDMLESIGMPQGTMIFADPSDFMLIYAEEIRYRRIDTGLQLACQDKILYLWFYWLDFVILDTDKMSLIDNVGAYVDTGAIVVREPIGATNTTVQPLNVQHASPTETAPSPYTQENLSPKTKTELVDIAKSMQIPSITIKTDNDMIIKAILDKQND
jgi:hypothetical protein